MRKLKKKQNAGESSAVPFDEIMSRVDDFYKRYVTSDNYKRLIEEGNYPIDPKRGLYRQYIMDEREGFSRGPGLQVDMGPYGLAAAFAGHKGFDRTDKGFFDSMFDPGMTLLSFLSDYEPSDRTIRFDPTTAGAENNPTLQEAILAHEYGHMLNIHDDSIDDFYTYTDDVHGMYMPKSIQNELTSRSKVGTDKYNKNLDKDLEKIWQEQTNPNREGYSSFVAVVEDRGYDSLEDAKEDWINDIKIKKVAHDSSPHERRADLMALRYLADKFNIYKAEDTRPFTMDDLNKLLEQEGVVNKKSKDEKGFSVADRMLQLFNKEDIVWQMNNVAFDPEIADDLPEGSMRAQDGREIPSIPNLPQEMLDKIQQLQSQQPKQGVIKPTLPFNPNTQFISGAQPGVIPGTEYANKVEQGYSELMGIAAPIPVLEAIKLSKFARVPGIIDDLVIDPVLQYASQFKTPFKAASKLFKKGEFVSEIDWGKWNAEIPLNEDLMREYAAIEQTTKKNGTWMKNPDGSDFTGPEELFVQVQSENFKRAYPAGYTSTYRGVQGKDIELYGPLGVDVNRTDIGTGIFTGDKSVAGSYADNLGNTLNLAMVNSDNTLKLEGLGNWHANLGTIGISKEFLKKNIDNLKKQIKETNTTRKSQGMGPELPDYNSASSNPAKLESFENFYNNYDEIVSNPVYKRLVEYKKEVLEAGKKAGKPPGANSFSTDDLAVFLEKEGLGNIQVNFVDDGMVGKVNVNNQIPGNYLKSLEGNNGMFD